MAGVKNDNKRKQQVDIYAERHAEQLQVYHTDFPSEVKEDTLDQRRKYKKMRGQECPFWLYSDPKWHFRGIRQLYRKHEQPPEINDSTYLERLESWRRSDWLARSPQDEMCKMACQDYPEQERVWMDLQLTEHSPTCAWLVKSATNEMNLCYCHPGQITERRRGGYHHPYDTRNIYLAEWDQSDSEDDSIQTPLLKQFV